MGLVCSVVFDGSDLGFGVGSVRRLGVEDGHVLFEFLNNY
jgi:hypothetical protein